MGTKDDDDDNCNNDGEDDEDEFDTFLAKDNSYKNFRRDYGRSPLREEIVDSNYLSDGNILSTDAGTDNEYDDEDDNDSCQHRTVIDGDNACPPQRTSRSTLHPTIYDEKVASIESKSDSNSDRNLKHVNEEIDTSCAKKCGDKRWDDDDKSDSHNYPSVHTSKYDVTPGGLDREVNDRNDNIIYLCDSSMSNDDDIVLPSREKQKNNNDSYPCLLKQLVEVDDTSIKGPIFDVSMTIIDRDRQESQDGSHQWKTRANENESNKNDECIKKDNSNCNADDLGERGTLPSKTESLLPNKCITETNSTRPYLIDHVDLSFCTRKYTEYDKNNYDDGTGSNSDNDKFDNIDNSNDYEGESDETIDLCDIL